MFISSNLALYPVLENMLIIQPQLYIHLVSEITVDLLIGQVLASDDLDYQFNNINSNKDCYRNQS